ncbi:MAG TPA: hypothetical protein VJU16_02625 [Planctomycetota bacterium]|nr:hypothetical protein [Planctomycetota bacterium]
MGTGKHYLARCLDRFPAVVESRMGMKPDLNLLIDLFSPIRSTADLEEHHIHALTKKDVWQADFFAFPKAEDCLKKLVSEKLDLRAPHDLRPDVVKRLRIILGTLENASLILRFVNGADFTIFSGYVLTGFFPLPLVANTEGVYLQFCRDLSLLGEPAGIRNVADVDSALWTLWQETRTENVDAEAHGLLAEYLNDPVVKRLRIERSQPLELLKGDPLTVADLVVKHHHRLAGKFAGDALESDILGLCDKQGVDTSHYHGELGKMADQLDLSGAGIDSGHVRRAWRTRCDSAHGRCFPKKEEVGYLVGIAHRVRALLKGA